MNVCRVYLAQLLGFGTLLSQILLSAEEEPLHGPFWGSGVCGTVKCLQSSISSVEQPAVQQTHQSVCGATEISLR